jgi:hypothetical protein
MLKSVKRVVKPFLSPQRCSRLGARGKGLLKDEVEIKRHRTMHLRQVSRPRTRDADIPTTNKSIQTRPMGREKCTDRGIASRESVDAGIRTRSEDVKRSRRFITCPLMDWTLRVHGWSAVCSKLRVTEHGAGVQIRGVHLTGESTGDDI